MTFKTLDRIFETSATAGAGDYTLDGAQVGFQAFNSIGANNMCPYFATDDVGWEIGIGKYISAPDRLQRTTILASSNGGAAVNWAAGSRKLRCGLAGALAIPRALSKDASGGAGTTVLTQDEQRRQIIAFTGVLTGNRVIEVDATPWLSIMYNNTTGAFSLTVRVTGQVGVVIPQGKAAVTYCDGVDCFLGGAPGLANSSEFASGTALVFHQTAAPVGWTKDATHNDKSLRVVSGTVGSGGATAFTSVFGAGKVTGSDTPSIAKTAAHDHNWRAHSSGSGIYTGNNLNTAPVDTGVATTSTGGGTAHNHTLSLDLQYADVMFATKD